MAIKLEPPPSQQELGQQLYETISDQIDEMSGWAQLKLARAFRDRPAWRNLDPELQQHFAAVARKL